MKTASSKTLYLSLLLATVLASPIVHADDIKLRIPVPPIPKIVLPFPPPMVWLPGPKVYVAHNSPHHIFYHENHYYLYDNDRWYAGPAYGGPWAAVSIGVVPPGLRAYKGRDWDDYEREADERFRRGHTEEGHYPFYARRAEYERHERAHWYHDQERRREYWRGDHGEREHNRGDRDEHDRHERWRD